MVGSLGEMELPLEVGNLLPYELSYGMYKRVELAIAIYDKPELLLLDEFFTSIDDLTKTSVVSYISRNRPNAKTLVTAHEEDLRKHLTSTHFSLTLDKETNCVVGILPS